ncbi:MAG: phosphoribosylformylglycinamidine synthase subunit PurS [Deltaproteobacteria bacterium]|nr:phosphoribosylformylglycinamidine synthase subunit PurS [Deltaproteobacteria bacterium]
MRATIFVTLKADVLDPQGKAIQRAAASLGYRDVAQVRQGKLFEVTLDAPDRAAAERLLREMGEKLLSNPVIEDYRIDRIEDAKPTAR